MDFGILGLFGAGLATFLTPCVLPLVPVYLSALAGADIRRPEDFPRGRLLLRAGLFAVGFMLVFILLGLAASSLGTSEPQDAALSNAAACQSQDGGL